MADYPKDQSKIPGGLAGGKASAQRPEEDRRESSRKAAESRRQDMVGPGIGAQPGQPQSYEGELRGATWAIEREGEKGAVEAQMRAGDEEAEAIEAARDRADPTYDPSNPREEAVEREMRGE